MFHVFESAGREIAIDCDSPILLGYGGSIAYGTNTPSSDTDIRGIYMNPLDEFIGTKPDSEQIVRTNPEDTVIYSFRKMLHLLAQCNPNVIELLGLRPEHYLFIHPIGQKLLDNAELFLSQRAIYTFGNYAKSQLNRLVNKSGVATGNLAANETRSLQKAINALKRKDGFRVLNLKAEEINGTPTISFNESIPIDQFFCVAQEIINVHNDYRKSRRNQKAVQHDKLAKHMMHLLRLYMMGIDILRDHKIVTYREAEHDLLMDIRAGKYLDGSKPTPAFHVLLERYTGEFNEAATTTTLPKNADMEAINQLSMDCVREYYAIRKDS